jgi:CheY-like chemotaxis protein
MPFDRCRTARAAHPTAGARLKSADLPALLVSGDSAPDRVRLMQHSGLPWLAKPVSPARLRSWLSRAGHVAGPVEEPA